MDPLTMNFKIKNLGECKIDSPISYSRTFGDGIVNFVNEDHSYVTVNNTFEPTLPNADLFKPEHMIERAGPREKIFFNPGHVHAGIVTCGGLCPGLNDIIRSIVRTLWYRYGIKRISGIQYGFLGFLPEYNFPTIDLTPDVVDDIHKNGGTILGSARGGGRRVEEIVDAMEQLNMNVLFVTGGDGTQRGSMDIAQEIEKRGLKIGVIGIPKTIDNDLSFIHKSFGFDTAVSIALNAVKAAHVEARCAMNGIGLVKLMGRHSGFIAAHTAIANHEANFVLIPEVPFDLEGEKGFLKALEKRIKDRSHAVILVAEGAGQEFLASTKSKDAGGNIKLADIGTFIKDAITEYFKKIEMPVNLKYIDPSYIIRAAAAIPNDAFYCARLGTYAVHAAMAGKTEMLISYWNSSFIHIPIKIAVEKRNVIHPEGSLWRDVLESTGQPITMKN